MCILNVNVKNHVQDDHGMSYVEADGAPLAVVTNSTFTDKPSSSSTLHRLPQYLCCEDVYICNFEKISENYNYVSLQKYSVKCGYNLTDDFLSIMNKCKIDFIRKVDSILFRLSSSFRFFLKESKENNKNLSYLMDKTCSSFSKVAYDLRPKCVRILQYNIIPIIIKNIFDSSVVDSGSKCKMIYPETEQLFIHFVTSLEKLIMVKIMNYWQDFCNKNNIFSLVSDIDYSNPFVRAYNFDGTSIPNISCPAAFIKKFGEYISFVAVAKIDEMMSFFIDKNIRHKFYCIFNRGSVNCNNIRDLRCKFKFLVKEEFDKKIIKERIKDIFKNFLDTIVIWSKSNTVKINMVLIFDNIIEYMNNFLVNTINSDLHDIVVFFQEGNRLGVYIHPEDYCKILSIRKRFSDKYKKAIRSKFCEMLKDEYKFSDGTVIGIFCWDEISKNILPIVHEILKPIVDDECKNLSRVISSARVVEDISVFDGHSAGTRKPTSEEIESVLKNFTDVIHDKNLELCIKIWTKLVDDKKGVVSKGVDFTADYKLLHSTDGSSSLVTTFSVNSKFPVDFSMPVFVWGLKLHSDDYNMILTIVRKFSIQMRDHLTELFSGMCRRKAILPSGRMMLDCSWDIVSSELYEIAVESLKSINEKQYAELDEVLSKVRIVNFNDNDFSSCIRKITEDEKKYPMTSIRKLMDENLRVSVKKSLSSVFNKYFIKYGYKKWLTGIFSKYPTKYGYKEKYKDVDIEDVEGMWGVKLRYSDNVSILKVRKKFSSIIKGIVYNKFSGMVKNDDKFDDGNYIGSFAWFRVSKKLLPIAKAEVRTELEKEREELEEIISKSRVIVDSKVDRELTDEEKSKVLEKIMVLVYDALKILFRRIWDDVIKDNVITTLRSDSVSEIGCVDKFSPSSVNRSGSTEFDDFDKGDFSKVKLCYEDDIVISNIRKKFSCEIYSCVSNKFTEMIDKKYKFDDDTVICLYSWRKMSKKLLPVIRKEIDPIIGNGLREISEALFESHVVVSSPDSSGATVVTRKLTSEEKSYVLKQIMESIYKKLSSNSAKIWNKMIKSPLSLFDLSEVDKLEINNIRLEFLGNLGLVVNDVINSLLPDIGKSSSSLEYMSFNACNIVYERSRNFFKEGGFLSRVELLLSSAKISSSSRGDRFITDEEKKCVLREFIDMIDSDRDNLVKKRTSEKLNNLFFSSVDLHKLKKI